jgi:hypothetical protein
MMMMCLAFGGMRIRRGHRSTRRKPTPVPLCSPQIPHDLTWARIRAATVGSRRLTVWAMARPLFNFLEVQCSKFCVNHKKMFADKIIPFCPKKDTWIKVIRTKVISKSSFHVSVKAAWSRTEGELPFSMCFYHLLLLSASEIHNDTRDVLICICFSLMPICRCTQFFIT